MERRSLWLLAGTLGIVGMVFFQALREAQRLRMEPATSWTDDHRADCGVVLTGRAGRISEGFDLLAQGMIRKLIISGVYPRAQLREIFPQIVFYGEIDPQDVILEKRSLTTYGNAQQTLALVEAFRCRDLVLITSADHMPRAYQTFQAAFPAGFPIYRRSVPIAAGDASWRDLVVEVAKGWFYSLWAY